MRQVLNRAIDHLGDAPVTPVDAVASTSRRARPPDAGDLPAAEIEQRELLLDVRS
jgi:hypothetical protein